MQENQKTMKSQVELETQSSSGSLIVRVKRRRNEISEVPQRLCIVESSESKKGLKSLSLTANKKLKSDKRVFLDLVSTLDSDGTNIDTRTMNAMKRSREESDNVNTTVGGSMKIPHQNIMWMTKGKKTLRYTNADDNSISNFLVVDMDCHDVSKEKQLNSTTVATTSASTKKGVRVSNPISRLVLEPAIELALSTGIVISELLYQKQLEHKRFHYNLLIIN